MASTEQLVELARAHFRHDDVAFRIALRRIAASCKTEGARRRLLALAAEQSAPRPMQPAAPSFRASPPGPAPAPAPASDGGLLRTLKGRPLDTVRLTEAIRVEIEVFLAEQKRADELRKHRLRPRQRILFHGPPGNGKTTLAGALAKELDVSGYVLDLAASTGHSYVGEQARLLQQAFGILVNPCVLLVDEIDAVAAERSSGEGDRTGTGRGADFTVCSLLQLMDQPAQGVLVAATNRVDHLDPAVRRRFELELELPAPTGKDVAVFAEGLFARHKIDPLPYEVQGAVNYDSVEKAVVAAVRRRVLFGEDSCSS